MHTHWVLHKLEPGSNQVALVHSFAALEVLCILRWSFADLGLFNLFYIPINLGLGCGLMFLQFVTLYFTLYLMR